jgi:hypothetical protein
MAWEQAGSTVYSILQNPSDVFLASVSDPEILFRFASRPHRPLRTLLKKTSQEVKRVNVQFGPKYPFPNCFRVSFAARSMGCNVLSRSPAFAMLALAPDASSQFCVYHAVGPLSSATSRTDVDQCVTSRNSTSKSLRGSRSRDTERCAPRGSRPGNSSGGTA